MPIDWFTVVAQAVNFLILVALLKHFLYGPVIRAMDERERRIADRLDEAERHREETERERHALAGERAELRERREEALHAAAEEAAERRQEMLAEAREAVGEKELQWQADLDEQHESLVGEVLDRFRQHVVKATDAALSDLAGEDLRRSALGVFVERVARLEEEQRHRLRDAARDDGLVVLSALELDEDERRSVEVALDQLELGDTEVRFGVDHSLIAGLEIRAGGWRLAGSFRRYVQDLDRELRETLRDAARQDPADDAMPTGGAAPEGTDEGDRRGG